MILKELQFAEFCKNYNSMFKRFESKAVKNKKGCWGWKGSTDGRGYGTLSSRYGRKGSPEKAHRVSFEIHYGEIPEGMHVCHSCDNPICTNPHHLFLGSQKDNMMDCSKKGRLNKKSLENLKRDKALSDLEVDVIKSINFKAQNGRGKGVTVKDVAAVFGVSNSTITKVKHNRY